MLDWESCFSVNDYGGEVKRFIHINGRLYIHLLKPDARQGKLDEILTLRKAELAAKKTLYNPC